MCSSYWLWKAPETVQCLGKVWEELCNPANRVKFYKQAQHFLVHNNFTVGYYQRPTWAFCIFLTKFFLKTPHEEKEGRERQHNTGKVTLELGNWLKTTWTSLKIAMIFVSYTCFGPNQTVSSGVRGCSSYVSWNVKRSLQSELITLCTKFS